MALGDANSTYGKKAAAALANPVVNTVWTTADAAAGNTSAPTTAAAVYVRPQDSLYAGVLAQLPVTGILTANLDPRALSFEVRATGRVITGTSGTFGVTLLAGNSATYATNTVLHAPAPATYAANGAFLLDYFLEWDNLSGVLGGQLVCGWQGGATKAIISPVMVTQATIANFGVSPNNGLCMAGIFGTSNAGNLAYLDEFVVEIL